MPPAIKAIETKYAGCRFRSRLEARYAVLFTYLGIRWDYEHEGYETPHGRYLPDFLLHLPTPTLFEVKPESELGTTDLRWWHASRAADMPLIVAYGMPKPHRLNPQDQPGDGHYNLIDGRNEWEAWDNTYAFCICCTCGAVGIEFCGRAGRVCHHKGTGNDDCATHDGRRCYSSDHVRLVDAYTSALSARFEHGESPRSSRIDSDPFYGLIIKHRGEHE